MGQYEQTRPISRSMAGFRAALCILTVSVVSLEYSVAEPSEPEDKIKNSPALQELVRKNEVKWRETYKSELSKPVLSPIATSSQYMPNSFEGLTLGMGGAALQKQRPNAKDRGFAGASVRNAYEFVPASFNEAIESTTWERAVYKIHRRRLVGVTFFSVLFTEVAKAS